MADSVSPSLANCYGCHDCPQRGPDSSRQDRKLAPLNASNVLGPNTNTDCVAQRAAHSRYSKHDFHLPGRFHRTAVLEDTIECLMQLYLRRLSEPRRKLTPFLHRLES